MDYPTISCFDSTFIAIGAVVRVGVDQVGDMVPGLAFAVVIKLGLSETLTSAAGFTYGLIVRFVTGFLITLLSLFYSVPIIPTMLSGFQSLVTAMANNVILFPTVGSKAIKFVQEHQLTSANNNGPS